MQPLRPAAILLPTFLAVSATPAAASDDPTLVATTVGSVRGLASDTVTEWLGIPYALPPVVARRWQQPVPVTSWDEWPGWETRVGDDGVLRADQRGSDCIQPWDEPHGSEDCLYLNVTAPAATAGPPLPVFVHLHGGGNFFGAAEQDASPFAERGVVVVTLNYRLGVMGMLAHPALTAEAGTSSNYNLWDTIAALEWVRANIAGFGGDPDNVTLGGFSAGAGNVVGLLASDEAAGLFHRAAPHAIGNYWINGFDSSLTDREGAGEWLAASVGCGDDVPDVAACLRDVPAETLVMAMGGNDWGPTTDGVLLEMPVIDWIAERGTVPLLIGHNREEDSFALHGFAPDPLSWSSFVHLANDLVGANLGRETRSLYPESAYGGSLYWALVAMTSDAAHGCPVRRVANATRTTTFRYLYTHVLELHDWAPLFRAYHGAEHDMLWGGLAQSPTEQALSDRMLRYWTNFMKTGDPNRSHPDDATPPTWPAYNPVDEKILVLDTEESVTSAFRRNECAVLDQTPIGPSCNTAICRYITHRLVPSSGWHPVFGFFFPLMR